MLLKASDVLPLKQIHSLVVNSQAHCIPEYPLLAMLPILALPVLLGGITFGHFWRTVLAPVNATFFAMAAGFTASALCLRQFPAVAAATGLALFFGIGVAGVGLILRALGCPVAVADTVAAFCPLHTLIAADKGPRLLGDYWFSLSAVSGGSFALLAIAVWRVGRIWRDRAKRANRWSQFGGGFFASRGKAAHTAFRRRLLEINPLFWLAGRQRVSAPVFMLLTVGLVALTAGFTAPYFGRVIRAGVIGPMLGHLFAWL